MKPFSVPPVPGQPRVSVLIANYNYAHWVDRALDSLRAQTYPHWEAIVCDDGSTDDSRAVIARYADRDPRIRLITQGNQGMAAALNHSFRYAQGSLVALLDSDDEYEPDRLHHVIGHFLAHPRAGLVTHPVRAVHASGRLLKPRHPRRLDTGWLAPAMLAGREPGLPPCSGLTFHSSIARFVFPLPEHFRRCADKIAQDRAALLAPVAALPHVLARYRIHGANLTGLSGPFTLDALDRNFEFLELLWADRRAFVARHHGFTPDIGPWRDVESAHLHLARRLFTREPGAAGYLSVLSSPLHRHIWRLLLAVPAPLARRALCLWWSENGLKRLFRNSWDQFRAPA